MANRVPLEQPTSEYAIFAKRIGLVGVVRTIVSLQGLIILPILTKILGASGYGIWAQVLVTLTLLQPLALLGLDASMVRFLSSKGKGEIVQGIITILSIILLTSVVISLILFLSSNFLAITLLEDKSAVPIIKVASLLVILGALNATAISSFIIFGQVKRYSAVILINFFLETGLIALFVLSGHGLLGAIIALLIARGIVFLVVLYLIISYAGFAFPNFSLLRPYLGYGLPLVPTVIFTVVVDGCDRYVIGFFMGAAWVGIYSAAYGMGVLAIMFLPYIACILGPTIFKLYDEGKNEKVKLYLSYSWKYLMMLLIPSAFGLSILAGPLLGSLTTPEFVSAGKFIVPVVALSMIFYGVHGISGYVLRLVKRTQIFAITLGAAAAVNLGLNVIFVPRWGIMGAAVTTLISYIMVAVVIYYQSHKYMKFNINLNFIIKSILSSAIMTLAIWAFNPIGTVNILLSVVIGVIIYFGMLFLLRGFNKEELKIISQIVGLKSS